MDLQGFVENNVKVEKKLYKILILYVYDSNNIFDYYNRSPLYNNVFVNFNDIIMKDVEVF